MTKPTKPLTYSFDPDSHIYRLHSGVEVPGVTRVIDTGGLVDYKFVHEDILEAKSEIGVEVHRCTVLHDRGVLDLESVDPACIGCVRAYILFREITGFEPRLREEQLVASVNGFLYGMRIDATGIMTRGPHVRFGQEVLIEIKTTSRIMPHHEIQTAGYALGLPYKRLTSPLARFYARARFILQLRPDATYRLIPCTNPEDANTFLALLGVSAWRRQFNQIYREAA